jgi:hypothetical protein
MRRDLIVLLALAAGAVRAPAQEPLLGARAVNANVGIKIFNPAGSVRITAWDKDSVVVRGHMARGEQFRLSGDARGLKLDMMARSDDDSPRPSTLIVFVPRGSTISVKSPLGDITGTGVTGWFYTVSGTIRLDGISRSIEAQAISGDIDIAVTAPMVRAQTGDGRLTLRGAPEDADVSTVGGPLSIATAGIVHGRFASVSGDIEFAGAPAPGGVLDFTDHGGAVTLILPPNAAGVFDLSSIVGRIENGMSVVRPAADAGAMGLSLRLTLGERGTGGRVTVRTFKGAIRLRPQAAP